VEVLAGELAKEGIKRGVESCGTMICVAEASIEEAGLCATLFGGSIGSLGVGLKRLGSATEASKVSYGK